MSRRKINDQDDRPTGQQTPPPPYPLDQAIAAAHCDTEAGDDWIDGDSGDSAVAAGSSAADGQQAALVSEGNTLERRSGAPAPDTEPPPTLAQQLLGLPQWQVRVVAALMECGGNVALASRQAGVGRDAVARFRATSQQFDRACRDATDHACDLVEASLFRGATIGDLTPVFQGGILAGWKRVRSDKAAELFMTLQGRMQEKQQGVATVSLPIEAVPAMVAEAMTRLYAARQQQGRTLDVGAQVRRVEPGAGA